MRINRKNIPSYEVPDRINYYWTSNQPDAFFLEDTDRRYFVHEITSKPLPEQFYRDYDIWMRSGEAGPAVFDYLLRLDLGDFNPHAPALRTVAKERMTEDARSDLGVWVRNLLAHPDAVLKVGAHKLPGDLFTNKELLALYDPEKRGRVTANGLGRELRRAGAALACGGMPVRYADGRDRFYAVRDGARWATAPIERVRKHVESRK
jgi:hypothetical protein